MAHATGFPVVQGHHIFVLYCGIIATNFEIPLFWQNICTSRPVGSQQWPYITFFITEKHQEKRKEMNVIKMTVCLNIYECMFSPSTV